VLSREGLSFQAHYCANIHSNERANKNKCFNINHLKSFGWLDKWLTVKSADATFFTDLPGN
jgi:hypothetical protein